MTALKPLENRNVRGVASERYPLNKKCAHPECQEVARDPHHCFPRSLIGGDSWFVVIHVTHFKNDEVPEAPVVIEGVQSHRVPLTGGTSRDEIVIPHVTGLCRAHHDDVEEHRAWIKLEDGVWNWYDKVPHGPESPLIPGATLTDFGRDLLASYEELGPLNPQPGSQEGKAKRRKHQGEAKRKRITWQLHIPKDEQEDGAGVLDDLIEQIEEKMSHTSPDGDVRRPAYYTLADALNWFVLNYNPEEEGDPSE